MSVALAKVKMEIATSPTRSVRKDRNDELRGGISDDGHGFTNNSNEKKDERLKGTIATTITKIKVELSGTPRTEASSPDSRDGPLDVEDDYDEAVLQKNSTASDDTTTKDHDIIPERGMMDEMTMSQTDQHIHQLDRDGELNEVAGSQSMLSQELIYDMHHRNRPENGSRDDDDDDDGKNSVGCLSSLHLSQETETSVSLAKRIGLLSMTQDEEEGEGEGDTKPLAADIGTNGTISKKIAEGPCTPKRSESLLSVLSHASRTGAPDLASFSAKKEIIAAENKPKVDITDTPVRESEGFGSLLDAVAKITEQEISEGEDALSWRRSLYLLRHPDVDEFAELSPTKRKRSLAPRHASISPTRKSPRKSAGSYSKRKMPMAAGAASSSSSTRKRKTSMSTATTSNATLKKTKTDPVEKHNPDQKKSVDGTREAQEAAIRAAALAERIVSDPGLAKQLLLSMALVRENPRSAPETLPGPGHVLPDGFVWARYPPLENVLKKHMAEYYQLSTEKCQSAQQQAFNNDMVVVVREVAEERRWYFADCFDDRALRDRIRCYYKTHIQNAKKRLRTMVRNPTKRANAKHLLQHLEIIQRAKVDGEKVRHKHTDLFE